MEGALPLAALHDSLGAQVLANLRTEHPGVWMTITNMHGDLVPKSLHKLCRQRHVQIVENDDGANLAILLEHMNKAAKTEMPQPSQCRKPPSQVDGLCPGEVQWEKCFAELCLEIGATGRLNLKEWLQWDWLRSRVGPAGSKALLTNAAAEAIWQRVVGDPGGAAGADHFVELAQVVECECSRAMAIQSALRGRVGRRVAEGAKVGQAAQRLAEAPKLAPFNPTPECAIMQALDALNVGPGDLLYDLGCGDGRLLVAAAIRGARALGVEYDERFVSKAQEMVQEARASELVEVVHGDASSIDLKPATKIFVYLVPSGLQRIAPLLNSALERGVPIASYTFSIPGLHPTEVLSAETRAPECKVRIYRRTTSSAPAEQGGLR